MKFSQLHAFEKHLANAAPSHFSPLYIIIGKENFACRRACELVLRSLFPSDESRALCTQSKEVEELTSAELKRELYSHSLFSGRRALQIRGLEKANKELIATLENYFSMPNSSLHLILSAATLSQNSNLYKKGEKSGIIIEFAELKPWEQKKALLSWIVATLASEGIKITPTSAQQLIATVGARQELLYNELQKLITYVGAKREIVSGDISALCGDREQDSSWQLAESIMQGDAPSALRNFQDQFQQGVAPIALLRQLRSQFHTSYQICALLATKVSHDELTRHFPSMRGALLQRQRPVVERYGLTSFKAAVLSIDEAEREVKNSSIDPEAIVELLIMKLLATKNKSASKNKN